MSAAVRLAHQGDRDDDRRHGAGARRARSSSTQPVAGVLRRVARRGSRGGDRPRSAGARLWPARSPGRCRRRRPPRVRARDLRDPARVRAADAVDLQRPRVHPARVSCGGPRRRAARRAVPPYRGPPQADITDPGRQCPASAGPLTFGLPPTRARRRADAADGRGSAARPRSVGEVHDNYAAALGGVAGHAGLFGTAPAVGAFARAVLRAARASAARAAPFSPELVAPFTDEKHASPAARARSAGIRCCRLRRAARGCRRRRSATSGSPAHRSGSIRCATATSCCSTNRVCGGGTLDEMRTVRRAFHDALGDV